MWLADVTEAGSGPALEKMMAYAEERHRMLAENIANIDTPGYKTKQLDPKLFQAKLREAIEERGDDKTQRLKIGATQQFYQDQHGSLRVSPALKPPQNVLFHDGTNPSMERQMADLAENTLTYQVAVELKRARNTVIRQAIAGRTV